MGSAPPSRLGPDDAPGDEPAEQGRRDLAGVRAGGFGMDVLRPDLDTRPDQGRSHRLERDVWGADDAAYRGLSRRGGDGRRERGRARGGGGGPFPSPPPAAGAR